MRLAVLVLKLTALALLFALSAQAAERVNINTADAAELDRVLLNVGPSKAQAIIEHRQANGPFRSAEELALVRGIGLKTVERNRDLIEVGVGGMPTGRAARTPSAEPVQRR